MKKMIMMVLCVLILAGCASASDDVCGNSFKFFHDEVMFILKFESSDPVLPCTSGQAVLFWQDNKKSGSFAVNLKNVVTVTGIGKFVLDGASLYFLDSATVVFESW